MRKNIFFKSTVRQPLRTVAIMLLIGVAAFSFFLRTVEFVAVRAELTRLGDEYITAGFVRYPDFWADVSGAAEILENSPFVNFADRRVGLEGVLHNMHNADIAGMRPGIPREEQQRVTDVIIFGSIGSIHWPDTDEGPVMIGIWPRYILAGYFEHTATLWESLWMTYVPSGDGPSILDDLQVHGEYYIFHASFYEVISPWGTTRLPNPRAPIANLSLNAIWETDWEWEWLETEEQWVFHMGYIWEELREEIAFLNRNHRTVNLQPVRDMRTLPHVNADGHWQLGVTRHIEARNPFRLVHGRMLTYEDYTEARPVVVIDRAFALIRNLQLGDILHMEIPRTQEIYGINHAQREMFVRSVSDDYEDMYVFSLEIVGMYNNTYRNSRPGTYATGFMYIPASILPDNMEITFNVPDMPDDALPAIWFNFTLAQARPEYEQRFLERYRPVMEEMGLILTLFESGSREFWLIVDPIITTLTFNAVVFWIVLVLVCALVVFLYINSRRREMAIQQALGFSRTRIVLHLLVTALFFSAPGIIIGGFFGWRRAIYTAEYTLGGLSDVLPGFVPAIQPIPEWALFMGLGIFAVLFIMVLGAALYISGFPVLDQLQGILTRARKKKHIQAEGEAAPGLTVFAPLPPNNYTAAPSMSFRNSINWVWRQISRSRIKTVLLLLTAAFFVLVLGWLQEAIDRTETDIENLYDLTEVWGEIRQENPFDVHDGRYLGDVMHRITIDLIRDTGYVTNMFIEAGHYRSVFVPAAPDGGFPSDWQEIIGFDRSLPLRHWQNFETLDMLFAFNDIGRFFELNSGEDGFGVEIEFYGGYGKEDFYYSEYAFLNRMPIPVILPEFIMERRGFALGDTAYLGYTRFNPAMWHNIPVKIIGVHNSQVFMENASNAAFIPLAAYEEMLRGMSFYTTFSFMIDTAHNRDVTRIGEELSDIAARPTAGLTRLQLVLSSHDLYTLVGIASQTLLLLQLVYPLAVGASVLIAMGLSLLLMLQTAKNAAILRVLGASKGTAALMLLGEVLLVCIAGAALGLAALAILGAAFGTQLAFVLALYFGGVLLGAVAGAIIIFSRTPMRMLQVKE